MLDDLEGRDVVLSDPTMPKGVLFLGHGDSAIEVVVARAAAQLYGLSEAQLRYIFETFHEGWDYGPRLEAVAQHFQRWQRRG